MSGYPVSDLLFISGYVSQLYRWDLQNVTFKVTTHSCGEDLRQKNYVKDYVDTYFWERKHGVRPVLVAMGLARVQEVRIPALNTWWTFFTLNCNNSSKTLKISKKRLGMANLKYLEQSNLVAFDFKSCFHLTFCSNERKPFGLALNKIYFFHITVKYFYLELVLTKKN